MIHSGWRYVILLGVLAGCNGKDKKPAGAAAQDSARAGRPVSPAGGFVALPTEKTDTIRVEGNAEPIKVQLVQPPSSVPFLTYIPADMISETRSSNMGEAHYFYANFGGKRNSQAYLLMNVLPAGTTMANAVAVAKAFREAGEQAGYIVSLDLRMHGNRYYFIGEHYPSEYADGLPPRSHIIQSEWKWLDATASRPRPE